MTARESAGHRRIIIRNSRLTCIGLMIAFALGGLIFKVLAITIPVFRIAGGLIIGKTAFDMLRAETHRATGDEIEEGRREVEMGITPLAVPILAWPVSRPCADDESHGGRPGGATFVIDNARELGLVR